MSYSKLIKIAAAAVLALSAENAFAADKKAPPSQPAPAAPAQPGAPAAPSADESSEKVNVENIKEKYWARGDESELGVVQNRLYSKQQKWELDLFGGFLTSDPFLSVKNAGANLGYHLTETWGVHVMGWKAFVSDSSAKTTLEQGSKRANTNPPRYYFGSEVSASILYGKLSLVGKKIIYYDMHLLGGAGATGTENGTYFTPSIGIGQQVYLNKFLSLNVDYRLMYYNETIKEKEIPEKIGHDVGTRANWTNAITIGVGFLIGGDSK